MLSPRIVPYQPNAAARSRRIDAEDWEKRRACLEELYIKDDKKLEEVMEIMALSESFNASRRQYTQKFKEWGLCKNIPAKVMKSALRKRARAGEVDVSIKYRGTAIAGENMDRWQQRVPTFNPMSSPTASTSSQMIVASPQVVTDGQQGETLRSPVVQSPPMNVFDNGRADDIDDMVSIAYGEIRRSGSPQLVDYIFYPKTNKGPFIHNDSTGVRGLDHILNISMTELELRQLSDGLLGTLGILAKNLWNFGKYKHLNYCLHIEEIFLARWRLFGSEYVDALCRSMRNVSIFYLQTGRLTECERFLIDSSVEINSLQPGHPAGAEFRSLLGEVHSRQGNHNLAEELCTQAIISSRANTGLAHHRTWSAYHIFSTVLEVQGRPDDGRRLMMGLYQDIYRTVSAQLLPGLSACLELCKSYIERWMHESKLQRLVKESFVFESPLGIDETQKLILCTVVREGWQKQRNIGTLPSIVTDVMAKMGFPFTYFFSTFAQLTTQRIQAVRQLGSISLQQEALRVISELKATKFLVPLWIFSVLNESRFWRNRSGFLEAERDLIESLQDMIIEGDHYTKADEDSLVPPFTIATNPRIHQSDLLNNSESSMVVSTVTGQACSSDTSTDTFGLHNGNIMPSVLPSPTLVQPGSQLPSASIQVPYLVRPDHMASFTPPTTLSWNNEPSVPRSLSPAQSRQISGDNISHNWFSASTAFSRLPSAAQGGRPFDNAPQTSFSPMMVTTPTPPFMSSLPSTPRSLRMFPPRRPGEDSPVVPPSSILAGRADFPISPNLFGLPQSPLASSPSLQSGSSPWPRQVPLPMDRSGSSLDGDSSNGTLFQ